MIEFLLALKIPLIVLQIITCPLLIGAILLQSGKEDDLGSALGGGGSGSTVLGTGGTSKVLVKATAYLTVVFMINSIALAKIYKEELAGGVGVSVSEPLAPATTPTDSKSAPDTKAAPGAATDSAVPPGEPSAQPESDSDGSTE